MKRNNLLAFLLAVLLFASGMAVGALAHRYYSPTIVVASSPERFRESYISELRTKLSLDSKQVTALHEILDHTKTQMRAIRERTHPEMVKIREDQIREVKAMLRPDQVPLYDKLLADRERLNREQEARDQQEELKRRAAKPSGN